MGGGGERRSISLVRHVIAALLLGLLSLQLTLAFSLYRYGGIPLPKPWTVALIGRTLPESLRLDFERILLRPDASLELRGVALARSTHAEPFFEADRLLLSLHGREGSPLQLAPKAAAVSGGRLYLPPGETPDVGGDHLLHDLNANLRWTPGAVNIDAIAARHESIHFRGAINLAVSDEALGDRSRLDDALDRSFAAAAEALALKPHFAILEAPTLSFAIHLDRAGRLRAEASLSSPELNHPEVKGRGLLLSTLLEYEAGHIRPLRPIRFQAAHLEMDTYALKARQVIGELPAVSWEPLTREDWPDLYLAARSLSLRNLRFETPVLRLDPRAFPKVAFDGTAEGLGGAVAASGAMDLNKGAGSIRAAGQAELDDILPAALTKALPPLRSEQPPYYRLQAKFLPGFEPGELALSLEANELAVQSLQFDTLFAEAFYDGRTVEIRDAYFRRDRQWLDFGLRYDLDVKDYVVTLVGSGIPDEYNPILPAWWASVFKDFDFTSESDGLGDFVIRGNAANPVADSFFGHVQAENLRYRGIGIDAGELFVRGEGRYVEVHRLAAHSDAGFVRGDIAFTSLPDAVRAPLSVRFDIDARFPPQKVGRIFGEGVAASVRDFEVDTPPEISLEGQVFNARDYPEFAEKTGFRLAAQLDAPLQFRGLPLDHLAFTFVGRSKARYLRDLEFGYAGGTGRGRADIRPTEGGGEHLHLQLELRDARRDQALRNLPLPGVVGDTDADSQSGGSEARLDFHLHAEGDPADMYSFQGYGGFETRDPDLASVDLLGPLSRRLEATRLNFTTFGLETMEASFDLRQEHLSFRHLEINGPRSRIDAAGTLGLRDYALDMQVDVYLFANVGGPESNLRRVTDQLRVLPNILEFKLGGTLDQQIWRSVYDPRNYLPDILPGI